MRAATRGADWGFGTVCLLGLAVRIGYVIFPSRDQKGNQNLRRRGRAGNRLYSDREKESVDLRARASCSLNQSSSAMTESNRSSAPGAFSSAGSCQNRR